MKRIFLALLALVSVTAANAQKNSILAFGTAGVDVINNDNAGTHDNTTAWHVMPGVGYQFDKHHTLGLQGGYRNSTHSAETNILGKPYDIQNMDNEWQIGIFHRYTCTLSPIFTLFGQANVSYVSGGSSDDVVTATSITTTTDNYNGVAIGMFPAIGVNVHKGLALNFGFGGANFRTVSWDKAPMAKHTFDITFGQQFNVGISKNFNCKSKKRGHGHSEPGHDVRRHKKMDKEEEDEE